jgi:hypothetical protein
MIWVVVGFGDIAHGAPAVREDHEAADAFLQMIKPFVGTKIEDENACKKITFMVTMPGFMM